MKEIMDQNSDMTPTMKKALRMVASRRQSADHQGPHDMKQAAALAEYLRDTMIAEGASDDQIAQSIISMLNNPTDFAEEFAEVQGREAPPELDGEAAAQPMPAMDEAPPGATMPMPGMQPPPGSTVAKVAADNIAGKCPNCASHTTGIVGGDGDSMCHACNKTFKTKEVVDDKTDTAKSGRVAADEEPSLHDHEDLHQHDESVPSTMRWVDDSGQPLEVGSEYKMLSNRSDIPDFIKVLGPGQINSETGDMGGPVIGDTLKYEITGEYGLNHTGDLTIEEFDDEEISFEATNDGDDVGDPTVGPDDMLPDDPGNSDRTMFEGSPEQTDLSTPTIRSGNIWGRNARSDEFARPEVDRPSYDPSDASYPLVDAPYPNKFSSVEEFNSATSEWEKEHLSPALNQRAAKSLTKVFESKIAKGEEIDNSLWNRIESLGGPRYSDDGVLPPNQHKPNPNEDDPYWHPPTAEDREVMGGRDSQVGRGLVLHPEGGRPVLHSWPISVADRMNDPQSELSHADHMRNINWDPQSDGRTAMFDISTDGPEDYSIEPNSIFNVTDEDRKLIESFHPELAKRQIMSKAAAAKASGYDYDLMAQKEFIGEQGIARNSDKLDLENTHYAETAMEDHFLFGLL